MVPLPLESTFVVRIDNATLLSNPLPVFTFVHPDLSQGEFRRRRVGYYYYYFIRISIQSSFSYFRS